MAMMTISPRFMVGRGDHKLLSGPFVRHVPSARARYAPAGPDPADGGGHG
jgi:hypothetical protein